MHELESDRGEREREREKEGERNERLPWAWVEVL